MLYDFLRFLKFFFSTLLQSHALLNRVENVCSTEEKNRLLSISSKQHLRSTLLPIRSVGVQGDKRSYSYVSAISSDGQPEWEELMFLARIIPKVSFLWSDSSSQANCLIFLINHVFLNCRFVILSIVFATYLEESRKNQLPK